MPLQGVLWRMVNCELWIGLPTCLNQDNFLSVIKYIAMAIANVNQYFIKRSCKLLTKLTKKWKLRLKLLKNMVFHLAHCQRCWRTIMPWKKLAEITRNPWKTVMLRLHCLCGLKMPEPQIIPISGSLLQEKANEYVTGLGIDDFQCCDRWLHRFKRHYDIQFHVISGE